MLIDFDGYGFVVDTKNARVRVIQGLQHVKPCPSTNTYVERIT